MHRDHDFDPGAALPANADALVFDIGLETLFGAMASGDRFLYDLCRKAVLLSLADVPSVIYRQEILKDCLANLETVRHIYDLCIECFEKRKGRFWGGLSNYPGTILHRSVEMVQLFVETLRKLKKIAETEAGAFLSEGFRRFFAMIREELSDAYFAEVQDHLNRLRFRGGVLMTARLGPGNKGVDFTLRKPNARDSSWLSPILMHPIVSGRQAYSFHIAERDDAGARALSSLRDRGINLAANALARSADHILSFITALRTELAFYMGCLNLHRQLTDKGEPVCLPVPLAPATRRHHFTGLYDAGVALNLGGKVTGNDVDADAKDLVIVTGANQGGKTTFLRSVGLAQLMLQCGMFVPARSFSAEICTAIFTHFKREEDSAMRSGKFDEELSRMSDIADAIGPDALLLFNESFAATNEREGSEIARQIVHALIEKRIKIVFVTHLFDFAHGLYQQGLESTLFLRAERQADGRRTFRMIQGEPLDTSYGEDLYKKIFAS